MFKPTSAPYSVHPSVVYVQSILRNLKALTGLDLEAWVAHAKAQGPATEKERRAWLKGQRRKYWIRRCTPS